MKKWKDTGKTSKEIIKTYPGNKNVVLSENTLVIIEKEISEDLFLVFDTNPSKVDRKKYKLKSSEIIIENYSVSRDINIQMLLADGWDAQDLLRHRK